MDFFIRKKVYLIVLIVILLLIPVLCFLLGLFSPGLHIDANLDLKTFPQIDVFIENKSSHVINNLKIFMNEKNVKTINFLYPKDKVYFEFPVNTETVYLKVTADNHLNFEKTFNISKENLDQETLIFKPTYSFGSSGKLSNVNLQLCNTSKKISLNIEIETDGDLKKGQKSTKLDLPENSCQTLEYNILYLKPGLKKVKFKIYNEIYSKELLISGTVK